MLECVVLYVMSNIDVAASAIARRIAAADAEDLFVLDIPNEDEYEEWEIPGSTNIPVYEELLEYDYSGLEGHLDETIARSLSDEPANYEELKQINWGKKSPAATPKRLNLVPTTAQRTNRHGLCIERFCSLYSQPNRQPR